MSYSWIPVHFCRPSSESYDRSISSTCRSDDITCTEPKDDDPIDCRKIEDRISAGNKCLSARAEMTSRCFDGRWNWKRQSRKEADEHTVSSCVELLKYKQDRSLCK